MHANDNEPAYFSRAVLDRSLVMRQRLRMIARQRRRAAAAGNAPPAPPGHPDAASDWHYCPRLVPWPRRWDDIGIFNQYGIAVVATLVLSLGTLHVVGFMVSG